MAIVFLENVGGTGPGGVQPVDNASLQHPSPGIRGARCFLRCSS